jgi:hypothetical protein
LKGYPFDESFNPTLSPTPPIDCHANDGVDHSNSFDFVNKKMMTILFFQITILKMKNR